MTVHENDQQFMRAADVKAMRRNRHRLRAKKVLVFLANLLFGTVVITGGYWMFHRIQEDERFAIRSIDIVGVQQPRRAELTGILDQWSGANLFRLEMDVIRGRLASIEWIDEVTVEKLLPDRMRVEIQERIPQAIIAMDGRLRFIDGEGVPFGEVAETGSYLPLPKIEGMRDGQAQRCIEFLEMLEQSDPVLHSRIDRIRPAGSFGWEIVDRDLGTVVRVAEDDVSDKWRMLYRIVMAERLPGAAIRYADLRFDSQIVIGHGEKVVQE